MACFICIQTNISMPSFGLLLSNALFKMLIFFFLKYILLNLHLTFVKFLSTSNKVPQEYMLNIFTVQPLID